MAKKKKKQRHILRLDDLSGTPGFVLTGLKTPQPLYKIAFDLNRTFHWDLQLQPDLEVVRKNKKVAFENYATSENAIGQKIRLVNNEILIPLSHPNSLFDTDEAFYLFQKLQTLNYILMLPEDEGITFKNIQQSFPAEYPVKFIEVDSNKCGTAFPVFPV